jgi:hypothetical protein
MLFAMFRDGYILYQIWWVVKYSESGFRVSELALAFKFLSNADLLQLHF